MDLARFVIVADEAMRDAGGPAIIGDAAMIRDWLSTDDIGAIRGIKACVDSSSEAGLARLDGLLLAMASHHADPAARNRLVKFYAMFKIVELLRFEEFHGFPG